MDILEGKRVLITGGCGFLGSNIARAAITAGAEVTLLDNLSRVGSDRNLAWLRASAVCDFTFLQADVTDRETIDGYVGSRSPEVVFHLAGQVAMTTSIADPWRDMQVNVGGSLNVLEAVRRHAPSAVVVYSSTNKVYGDLESLCYGETPTRYILRDFPCGLDEKTPLEFSSPYGCSKGAADQYMLDYARVFGLKTVVFRHSSMYGGRQYPTFDQGWVGWFCRKAVEAKRGDRIPFTISGTGRQVRDLLHADDMVALYAAAVVHAEQVCGQAFNIGGGAVNSLSLLELFTVLEEVTGRELTYEMLPSRQSDQKVFIADIRKAERLLEWTPQRTMRDGIADMLDWIETSMDQE